MDVKCCCKGCLDRHPGCHGSCKSYAAYKATCQSKLDETAKKNMVAEVHNDNRKRIVRKYELDRKRGKA